MDHITSISSIDFKEKRYKFQSNSQLENNIPKLKKIIKKYAENRVIEMFNLSFEKKIQEFAYINFYYLLCAIKEQTKLWKA